MTGRWRLIALGGAGTLLLAAGWWLWLRYGAAVFLGGGAMLC